MTVDALIDSLRDDIDNADNDENMQTAEFVKAYKDNLAERARISRSHFAVLGETRARCPSLTRLLGICRPGTLANPAKLPTLRRRLSTKVPIRKAITHTD
ncbi:hypothetical protein [Dechloromonas sp. A34]|uniref:hypothetical protein n=1 Tax=Dechloromonas sp. A34 TaxID=447588 RepID=UPI002249653D|nr:hypothetical protein [Dechloromonas sp. A34]